MRKQFISLLVVIMAFASILPTISEASTTKESSFNNNTINIREDDFLYNLGDEDPFINEFTYDHMEDYNGQVNQTRMAPLVVFIIVNGLKVSRTVYKAIKYAPKFPTGFKAVQNGTKKVTVKNKDILNDLRKIEKGEWKKIYKDGYDGKKKVSVHYFQSKSGLVFDVKTKKGWSNK